MSLIAVAPLTNEIPHVTWRALYLRLVLAGLLRPSLGIALVKVMWRFRRAGWYARFPFLPLPSTEYVEWRMHTAYGDAKAVPPLNDLIRYARWASKRS